jgi:hypothetical protein
MLRIPHKAFIQTVAVAMSSFLVRMTSMQRHLKVIPNYRELGPTATPFTIKKESAYLLTMGIIIMDVSYDY